MSNNNTSSSRTSILRSPQERKEILRKMITRAESLQEIVDDNTIVTLETYMEEADTINSQTTLEEKIHNQEETLMDSEMMNISSKVLKQCTRSLTRYMCSYDTAEFAQKVVQHVKQLPNFESETPDWSLLENQVTKCFKTTPDYSTLLGTLAPLEKKEINRRKPLVREAQAQIRRPENVVAVDKEEEGLEQTVKMKEFITRYYKTHRKPLDFFQLILHPSDFGKTIENILQTSFLARDGKIKITKNSSGILVVQPSTKEMMAQTNAGKNPNIQNVVYLNMEQWRMLKDTYRLEKPMIDFDNRS
ncbi:PREDICTED: non-structural maintenance of chromosomes element 4 homolog A-like [Dufourea novaeangliae]|uniref:Non-structural maintenance of chromosomes element 4 n=1 Tax=Dufourea novaeangliae TaxID=178035 RepID=A0A154P1D9_DUFNO|nr:PREDICTED: non-structural maintenance of chromosomes element 4 homolog A-like [Dufourea novaeangliae]XP_015439016.1 PREDICTED: non-structural maintenance of chromosomes element 4 homolog A-like [Dufourea novaeangliae]KZC05746.1 Non-structural maintenance of chromosomes element 4 like protein A [Dufourea novaeangliae]